MKKIELGNIYSIETNKGLGLFQLVNLPEDKKNEVEMIRVTYKLFEKIPKDFSEIFIDDFFYVCFPVKAALRKKLILLESNFKLEDDFKIPRYYRSPHFLRPQEEWIISDIETKTMLEVKELTEEQLKISPHGVWNVLYLKERLEEGWRLENYK